MLQWGNDRVITGKYSVWGGQYHGRVANFRYVLRNMLHSYHTEQVRSIAWSLTFTSPPIFISSRFSVLSSQKSYQCRLDNATNKGSVEFV